MALGGGTFVGQTKKLPGSYVNFVSLSHIGSALSERGAAAFALELDWGVGNEVFVVTNEEFVKNSVKLFGYDYTHEKLRGLRDLFRNARTLYGYRLGAGGDYARNGFGRAKYVGVRGNALSVVSAYSGGKYVVKTLLDGIEVDTQSVTAIDGLIDNDYVVWDRDGELEATSGSPFTGGTNPTVNAAGYQAFLNKIESCPVNAVGVCSDEPSVNRMIADFVKNMRDNVGVKMQAVVFNTASDHEGVVNVKNRVVVDGSGGNGGAALTYWVTGIIAGCAINKSNLNKVYDGEFEVEADFTQIQLEYAIKSGEFTLHSVGNQLRVLADINSLVTVTDDRGEVFKDNQTVRVIDQIANDIAAVFNEKYLGNVANDEAGRISFWTDIVKHHENLARIRAIENFSDDDVEVVAGEDKRSVIVRDKINAVNAMAQVYMTCVIS